MLQKLKQTSATAKMKFGVAAFLAIIIGIVILQNTEPVETQLLFMSITMPRAALLAVTLLIGIVAGILLTLGWSARRTRKSKD